MSSSPAPSDCDAHVVAHGREIEISHHRWFHSAEERRIQYQRISRQRGEFVEYLTRKDDEKPGYVVVQVPRV